MIASIDRKMQESYTIVTVMWISTGRTDDIQFLAKKKQLKKSSSIHLMRFSITKTNRINE